MTPRISVLMAVYNSAKWLETSLNSVLGQDNVQFEIVIVEDGSTDSSPAILHEYARSDSRIILIENYENLGLTRCLNLGLTQARGEYLARMDADDICLPGRLADQAAFLDSHLEVGVLGGWTRVINEQGQPLSDWIAPQDDSSIRAELLLKNNAFCHSTVMLRTVMLRQAGGYDETFRYAQDYELWTRLGRTTKLACIPRFVIEWRSSSENTTSRHRNEQLEFQFKTTLRGLEEHLGNSFDQQAFRRFWFALHGQTGLLEKNDIESLEVLWGLLGKHSKDMPRTLEGLFGFACILIRQGRRLDGFKLLSALSSHCGVNPYKLRVLRNILASLCLK